MRAFAHGFAGGRMALAALAAALFVLAGCSSMPKDSEFIFEKRNTAAQYAKQGDGFMKTYQYEQAMKYYKLSLEANQSVDNDEGTAASLLSIGKLHLAAGSLDLADEAFAQAKAAAENVGSTSLTAKAYACLAEAKITRGGNAEALPLLAEAEKAAGKDEKLLALIYHDKGTAKKNLEEYKDAIAEIEKAVEINLRTKNLLELGSNYYILASIHTKTENYAAAKEYAKKALDADKSIENSDGITGDYYALGRICRKTGDMGEAAKYQKKAFEVALAANLANQVKRALTELADLMRETGNAKEEARYREMLKKIEGK